MRTFAGLQLGRHAIPDKPTILNYRHLLKRHEITETIFVAIAEFVEARGALMRGSTIIDAALIAAPPWTMNQARKRDTEMRSLKMGNLWYSAIRPTSVSI
jgi:IS5 family transposase